MQFNMSYQFDLKISSVSAEKEIEYANKIKEDFRLSRDLDKSRDTNQVKLCVTNDVQSLREDMQRIQAYLLLKNNSFKLNSLPEFSLNGSIYSQPSFDIGPGLESVSLSGMMGTNQFNMTVKDNVFYNEQGKVAYPDMINAVNEKIKESEILLANSKKTEVTKTRSKKP